MPHVGMFQAKTTLSALVEQARNGEEVILTRHGEPVAKIVPYTKPKRVLGRYAHLTAPDADWSAVTEPMSEEELREIEEGHPGDPLREMAPAPTPAQEAPPA